MEISMAKFCKAMAMNESYVTSAEFNNILP